MSNTIKVSEYLAKRLSHLGIKNIFGLPGDYNFNLLKAIESDKDLEWTNCTNELNAGYAADGYARINGFGALITTYGVGELSAINAVAGAYAENVPIIKIVGTPSTYKIENKALIHHNFRNIDYHRFEKIYSNVVETTAFLTQINAKCEIDRIIEVMIKTRNPVYVVVPMDVCEFKTEDSIPTIMITSDKTNLKKATEHISKVINESAEPIIIADFPIKRFKVQNELNEILKRTNIPATTLLMGKGSIDETLPNFMGTNCGIGLNEHLTDKLSQSDCVITIGTLYADLNTGGFATQPNKNFKIDIKSDSVIVENREYKGVRIKDLLTGLITKLNKRNYCEFKISECTCSSALKGKLKIEHIFPQVQKILKPNDKLFIETGVISFCSGNIRLPKDGDYICQSFWGSIGWATPAAFGGAMADKSNRTILVTGEGSHQLTAGEVSNIYKHNLNMIIIVINNSGYTIERALSANPLEKFNDICEWDYSKLPEVFAKNPFVRKVYTNEELVSALNEAETEHCGKPCYIEVFTDKLDIPESVQEVIQNIRCNCP